MTIGELIRITRGDDIPFELTLNRNRAVNPIDLSATVRAWIVSDRTGIAVGPVTCDSAADGADWSVGLVVAIFPAATSAACELGPSRVEVEVNDAGLLTWHFPGFVVVKGQT